MNDDLDRNMGSAGQKDDQDFGQQSPGRNPQQGQQSGQKGAGQKNNPLEDDDESGMGGQSGQERIRDVPVAVAVVRTAN
jgi:hypothetical protein